MDTRSTCRALALGAALLPLCAWASSHREAPAIAGLPRLDGTDFYMFRSYESGRGDYVTFIANYIPLQDPGGGPNFYDLDTHARYEIRIAKGGHAGTDLKVSFTFSTADKRLAVDAGGKTVAVPLINIGEVTPAGGDVNVMQSYTVDVQNGAASGLAENLATGGTVFWKPLDNIGNKSIPDYATYAGHYVYPIAIPGCATPGRVFVGQRKEGFVANLGEIFDLINLNPAGPRDAQPNALFDKNVTSLAVEIPIKCVASSAEPVIAAYTASEVVEDNGSHRQVSRLGMPLVNELVIGLGDKDKFNSSHPEDDAQFLTYVTNPTLPVILHTLFGSAALVPGTPREDLVAVFLTGVKGLNQPANVTPSEMLRLNTSTPATAPAAQNDLGVLGGDAAGFPNGRRPYDDVVDITLRVAEGALCGAVGNCGSDKTDPNHGTPYTDEARSAGPDAEHLRVTGAIKPTDTYLAVFPYLNTPIPGSPNTVNGLLGISP